jgi:hypothetical protein
MGESSMAETILPFERPLSAGEVLDAGITLFKASLLRCLPLSLAAVVLGQLPTVYAMLRGRTPTLTDMGPLEALLVLLAGLANVVIWGAIMLRQRAIAGGHASTLAEVIGRPLARLLPVLGMILASTALVAVGLVLLVVPGLYLAVGLMFAYPAMLLDGESALGSIRSSLRLVRGNWWRTSMVVTVALFAIIVFYAIGSVVGVVIVQVTGGGDVGRVFLATSIVSALIGALFTPFMCAVSLAQYAELRLRSGGSDLEHRIESLPGG